jgi:hypothetical protein
VAEAFLKDKITIGHALLIAKLPAAQQQEAFGAAFRSMWTSEGNSQVLVPVRELAAWIESNILLQLASVPFDKQDEALVPAAASCVHCPKRTGFNKLLFADVRKDSCMLRGIWIRTLACFSACSDFGFEQGWGCARGKGWRLNPLPLAQLCRSLGTRISATIVGVREEILRIFTSDDLWECDHRADPEPLEVNWPSPSLFSASVGNSFRSPLPTRSAALG